MACGAIGIGEITSIPTAPAIADAYYRYDGKFRTSLPLEGTPYSRNNKRRGGTPAAACPNLRYPRSRTVTWTVSPGCFPIWARMSLRIPRMWPGVPIRTRLPA